MNTGTWHVFSSCHSHSPFSLVGVGRVELPQPKRPIYSRVGSPSAQHPQKNKKATEVSLGWLLVQIFVESIYAEATPCFGSFTRAWRLEYSCSGLAHVPINGAQIPFSHELVLVAAEACALAIWVKIDIGVASEFGCGGKI